MTPHDLFFEQGERHTQLRQGACLFGQLLLELLDPFRRDVRRLASVAGLGFQSGQGGTLHHALNGSQIVQVHAILAQDLAQWCIDRASCQIQLHLAGSGQTRTTFSFRHG